MGGLGLPAPQLRPPWNCHNWIFSGKKGAFWGFSAFQRSLVTLTTLVFTMHFMENRTNRGLAVFTKFYNLLILPIFHFRDMY